MKLVASALVETIVASTMFLIIFMIATTALTRLSAYHSGVDFVQVELDMENSVTLTRKNDKTKTGIQIWVGDCHHRKKRVCIVAWII